MSETGRMMTHAEALAEAEKRWGNADALLLPFIGCVLTKGGETMGTGYTWEQAFANADWNQAMSETGLSDEQEEERSDPRNAFTVEIVMHTDYAREKLDSPETVRMAIELVLDDVPLLEEIDYTLTVRSAALHEPTPKERSDGRPKSEASPDWPPVGMCCVVYPHEMGERLICQRAVTHSGAHWAKGEHCEYSWPTASRENDDDNR